jgi:glutathione S-transferase
MPHFYFHAHDRLGATPDETGIELDDRSDAYRYALDSIRSIVADDAKRGHLAIEGRITVADADHTPLFDVDYRDAFHEQRGAQRAPTELPAVRAVEGHVMAAAPVLFLFPLLTRNSRHRMLTSR